VTPIPAAIAKPLIAGLRNEIIVRDNVARCLFPAIHPPDYRTAVRTALEQLRADKVETAWTGALSTSQVDPPVILTSEAGMITEQRQIAITASAEAVFKAFTGLGGARGWLYMNWAWRLRGALDRLCGGVGLRRERRDADSVRVGDALDFWRVEAVEPNQLMRLRAEMKVPGKAWLQFEVKPLDPAPNVLLTQTAIFAPKGLLGFVYWYALYPIHSLIFRGLMRTLAKRATDIIGRRSH
jgi:hypothetical protein